MKIKKPTVYDIKRELVNAPYFFDRRTLRTFRQTLKSFTVHRLTDTTFLLSAPIILDGRYVGNTKRIWNAVERTLSPVPIE